MRILATLLLALFSVSSLPAQIPASHTSLQIKSFNHGKKTHKAMRHRGRKHHRA